MSFMLRPRLIGVGDQPPTLFRYGLPHHDRLARTFVPFIELGLPDDEAWEALFTDEQRLAHFRCAYGNRKGPVQRRQVRAVPTLFDEMGESAA